jgi:hypothetical protein
MSKLECKVVSLTGDHHRISLTPTQLERRTVKWTHPGRFGEELSIAEVQNSPSSTSRPML